MDKRDKRIIDLLFERSEAALELIQDIYGRLIRSVAFNLLHSDTVAEECVNDTLLAIWDTIPPERPDSLSAYAAAITRRRAIDRIRHDTAQKRSSDFTEYESVAEELAFADDVCGTVVDKMETQRILNEFLSSLSASNREIFISRFFDFESLDSISIRMHISKNALSVRISRMKADLSSRLRKEI